MRMLSAVLSAAGAWMAVQALAAPNSTAATEPTPCDRQIVMQIDSAKVSAGPDGFTIDAFGVAESAGWSEPALVAAGSIANGATMVNFSACRPEVSAMVLTPIQVHQTLKLDGATTRQIVIRAKTNSMTIDITQK